MAHHKATAVLQAGALATLILGLGLTVGCSSSDAVPTPGSAEYYGGASESDAGASSGAASSGGWGSSSGGAADGGVSSSSGGADAAGGSGPGGKDDNDPQTWVGKEGANPFATVDVGGGKKLVLEKVRIAVRVEGMRVRTLIDHIYSNPFDQQLEGTFRYSLPTESSVSYYAMFEGASAAQPEFFGDGDQLNGASDETVAGTTPAKVAEGASSKDWGKLLEARVHENAAAQAAYEAETEKKVDPGLVQQVAPNTFTAKVFPIPAKGRNRVLIAYEQTLPRVPAGYEYAFAMPEGDIKELDFTLVAFKKAVKSGKHVGKVELVTESDSAGAYIARKTLAGKSDGGTLVFQFGALAGADNKDQADVVAGTDPATSKDYAVIRLRPQIDAFNKSIPGADKAVFALDTSRSEHPKRFELNMQLIDGILAKSPEIKHFCVLSFDAGARWHADKWLVNDATGRKAFADAMQGILLEGATDFSAALRALAKPPMLAKVDDKADADVFVLSDGALNWGGRDLDAMLARYHAEKKLHGRIFAYRTGLGAENLALYHKLTRTGAIFNCMTQADLDKCMVAHRSSGVTIEAIEIGTDKSLPTAGELTDVLVAGRQAMLYPGAALTLAGRVVKAGHVLVRIKGEVAGKAITHEIPVDLQPSGELAPRAWAEIAVSQLFDSGAANLRGLGMALSQHYRIASAHASFVVLENEGLYKQYKLKEWAAKFTGQALSAVIDAAYAAGGKAIGTWARIYRLLEQHDGKIRLLAKHGKFVADIASAATGTDLEIADSTLAIPLVKSNTIWPLYLKQLNSQDAVDEPKLHVQEALRRRETGRIGASVRALSTAVELRPGDAEVARMAGYRLLSWNHLPEAAGQLLGVLEQRPLEPQSWRDLANAVLKDRPALAAVLFEAALSGNWHAKFKQITHVVREEYAMLLGSLPPKLPNPKLTPLLNARTAVWKLHTPKDALRVTVTWNTNNTDIDLWVTDPTGEKCFYNHKKLATGGKLLDDLTEGFGPERFSAQTKVPGKWRVQLHYYANNGNKLIAETYAQVTIATMAGTAQQSVSHYNVVLDKVGDVVEVATLQVK